MILSIEKSIIRAIIKKGILTKIECFKPNFFENFAAGKTNMALKIAAKAKNKKIAEKE